MKHKIIRALKLWCKNYHHQTSKNKDSLGRCRACHKMTVQKQTEKTISAFHISRNLYSQLVEDQQGKCAICLKSHQKLFVDHCHKTKRIRRLLCRHCNSGLGFFKDSVPVLLRAIRYIKQEQWTSKFLLGTSQSKDQYIYGERIKSTH